MASKTQMGITTLLLFAVAIVLSWAMGLTVIKITAVGGFFVLAGMMLAWLIDE